MRRKWYRGMNENGERGDQKMSLHGYYVSTEYLEDQPPRPNANPYVPLHIPSHDFQIPILQINSIYNPLINPLQSSLTRIRTPTPPPSPHPPLRFLAKPFSNPTIPKFVHPLLPYCSHPLLLRMITNTLRNRRVHTPAQRFPCTV